MKYPTFLQEKELISRGYSVIVGVDEAGAGALAGPLVAGAVVLPLDSRLGELRDSKTLTQLQKDRLYDLIVERSPSWAVGIVDVQEIILLGLRPANLLAMRRAVESIRGADYALVDAWTIPNLQIPQKGIIRGDLRVKSIAAASVIAKVTRDRMMIALAKQYPEYAFGQHKGYGTKLHRDLIAKYGPCSIHRTTYKNISTNSGVRMVIGLFAVSILVAIFFVVHADQAEAFDVSGRILLDVEKNGEAWYVNPVDQRRYYLGRPDDAMNIMKSLGLGISNSNFNLLASDEALRSRLGGRILLQVEENGEAHYVSPTDLNSHYLGRPADAFRIMSDLGLGISSFNLSTIPIGSMAFEGIYQSIPFSAQAPFSEWSDPRQQDGCEETSVLMAMKWVNGEAMSLQEAKNQIIAMSDWQLAEFGYFEDTSIQDTATRLFNRWFNYTNVFVVQDISSVDILEELIKGNIVIAATNGTKVNHSYYRNGGPERHVVLVHGYDERTREFIMHDPGTIYGADHRATAAELDYMLRDYASGKFVPIPDESTAMIVVRR